MRSRKNQSSHRTDRQKRSETTATEPRPGTAQPLTGPVVRKRSNIPFLTWPWLVFAAGVLTASAFFFGYLKYYSDGYGIEARAIDVPARVVLWEPAEALQGDYNRMLGNQDAALSPDGRLLAISRQVDADNSDLFLLRRDGDQGWTHPRRIQNLNTPFQERTPAWSADGGTLYFASDRPGGLGGMDIWMAVVDTARYRAEEAENLMGPVNSEHDELHPSPHPDGRRLFLTSNRPRPKAPGAPGIESAFADRADFDLFQAWPEPLGTPGYRTHATGHPMMANCDRISALNSLWDEGRLTLNSRGDVAYFTSNRPQGLGGFDLYQSRLHPDGWLAPSNAGPPLNTPYDEVSPQLGLEGFEIHFASNRTTLSASDFAFFRSLSREVLVRFDQSVFRDLLLALLLLGVSAAVLNLLLKLHRDGSMTLLTRCLLASLLLHILLGALSGSWYLSSRAGDALEGDPERWTISINNLARESVALAVRESTSSLPQVRAAPAVSQPLPTSEPAPQRPASQPVAVAEISLQPVAEPMPLAPVTTDASDAPAPSPSVDPVEMLEALEMGSARLAMEMPEGLQQSGTPEGEEVALLKRPPSPQTESPDQARPRSEVEVPLDPQPSAEVAQSLSAREARLSQPPGLPERFDAAHGEHRAGENEGLDTADDARLPHPPGSAPTSISLAASMGTLILPASLAMEQRADLEPIPAERDLGILKDDPLETRMRLLDLPHEELVVLLREVAPGALRIERLEELDRGTLIGLILDPSALDRVGGLLASRLPRFMLVNDSEMEVPEEYLEE